jgi:uncharacterized membrane protein YadS
VAAAGTVAALALPLGAFAPRVGAPIIALALGMAVAAATPVGRSLAGLGSISRYTLQVAIVLLGATISLSEVASVGASSRPVMLGSLATALITAAVLGRRLGVPDRLRILIGVGTGICGASAIAFARESPYGHRRKRSQSSWASPATRSRRAGTALAARRPSHRG